MVDFRFAAAAIFLSSTTAADDVVQDENGDFHFVSAAQREALPPITFIEQNPNKNQRLGLCQGDCDEDGECEGDLVCFQRLNSYKDVPGCSGGEDDHSDFDYCVNPESTTDLNDANSGQEDKEIPESNEIIGGGTDAFENDTSEGAQEDVVAGTEDVDANVPSSANEEDVLNEEIFYQDPNDPWQFLPFCKVPKGQPDFVVNNCKADEKNEGWAKVKFDKEIKFYERPLSGECGPHCRPSCVTLMLDLDDFFPDRDLICNENDLCHCTHKKLYSCGEERLENLFDEFPKCYLEDADCLGPTVFDDNVAYAEMQSADIQNLNLQHCKNIPDDPLFCRFQEWDIVTPIERYSCEDGEYPECLDRETKIYWEFCNIVEEDAFCDVDENCLGNRCGKQCSKKIEPFLPGWTTFTVTASVPLDPTGIDASESNYLCNERLPLAEKSKSACFMQRVEFYYPPEDEDCAGGCPNCHECPLLNLGDKFGPLEVVGFGHCIHRINEDHTCSSCDSASSKACEQGCELDCDDLFEWNCEESVDCHTEENMGFLNFQNNSCTWGINDKPPILDEPTFIALATKGDHQDENEGSNIPAIVVPIAATLLCVGLIAMYTTKKRSDSPPPPPTHSLENSVYGENPEMPGVFTLYSTNDQMSVQGDSMPDKKKLTHITWAGEEQ